MRPETETVYILRGRGRVHLAPTAAPKLESRRSHTKRERLLLHGGNGPMAAGGACER